MLNKRGAYAIAVAIMVAFFILIIVTVVPELKSTLLQILGIVFK